MKIRIRLFPGSDWSPASWRWPQCSSFFRLSCFRFRCQSYKRNFLKDRNTVVFVNWSNGTAAQWNWGLICFFLRQNLCCGIASSLVRKKIATEIKMKQIWIILQRRKSLNLHPSPQRQRGILKKQLSLRVHLITLLLFCFKFCD